MDIVEQALFFLLIYLLYQITTPTISVGLKLLETGGVIAATIVGSLLIAYFTHRLATRSQRKVLVSGLLAEVEENLEKLDSIENFFVTGELVIWGERVPVKRDYLELKHDRYLNALNYGFWFLSSNAKNILKEPYKAIQQYNNKVVYISHSAEGISLFKTMMALDEIKKVKKLLRKSKKALEKELGPIF